MLIPVITVHNQIGGKFVSIKFIMLKCRRHGFGNKEYKVLKIIVLLKNLDL